MNTQTVNQKDEIGLSSDSGVVEQITRQAEEGAREDILRQLETLHPADAASVLSHLPFERSKEVFHWLTDKQAGEVLTELDDNFRARLLEDHAPEQIASLVDKLDTDDAADLLADLPEAKANRILPDLEDAEEVEELLGYGEETAGGIMTTGYVTVARNWTISQATDELRKNSDRVAEALEIFVIDQDERLEGAVSLKCLLLCPREAIIGDVMTEVVSVHTDVDQEEVARIMERLDLHTLAVVDDEKHLVGNITIDDVVDVIREEAEEDIQRMGGLSGDEQPTDSIWRIAGGRLPWLLGGLLGAGLAALVVGHFEETLQQAVILAGFIPIVMAMAGNVGIQSSAVAVQGLASGDVWASEIGQRLGKEIAVAVINGLITAFVLALFILVLSVFVTIENPQHLALTAGISLIAVILLAAIIGASVPLALHRFGIDPALATGPFITTSNDILGVLIFFMLASTIYLP